MKYVLVNWSYNEPGRWLSICSTDHSATKDISTVVCGFLKSYRNIRYDIFRTNGGVATIEDMIPDEQASDVDSRLANFFTQNGWTADKFAAHSYMKIS